MLAKIALAMFLVAQPVVNEAQTGWKLARNENNIKVYTAKNESSGFKEVKVETVMEGTLQKLMAFLMDVGSNKHWVYNTKRTQLIRSNGTNEVLYYAETKLPWPFENRDMVINMSFDLNTSNNTLKILAIGMPDSLPEKSGIVRIKKFRAVWDVKYDGANSIMINYFISVNPGGNISPFISNMFVTKGPYESFSNLSKALK
jgi:hypothetical protein